MRLFLPNRLTPDCLAAPALAAFALLLSGTIPATAFADPPPYRDEQKQYIQDIDFKELVQPAFKSLSSFVGKKPADRLKGLQKAPEAKAKCFKATHNELYTHNGQSMSPSYQYAAHTCAAMVNWLENDAESACAELLLGAHEFEEIKKLRPPLTQIDARLRDAISGKQTQALTANIYKAAGCAGMQADALTGKAAGFRARAVKAENADSDANAAQIRAAIAARVDPPASELIAAINVETRSYDSNIALAKSWEDRGDIRQACTYYQNALSSLRKLETTYGVLGRVTNDSKHRDEAARLKGLQGVLIENNRDQCIAAGNRLI